MSVAPPTTTSTRHLAFRPWSVELRGDELADLRYYGRPVLRGLRAVVRDHNWLTLTPSVISARYVETPDALILRLDISWHGAGSRYAGQLEVRFEETALDISFLGAAIESFDSNRIGLIVLHRPDDAGRDVIVTSPSGSSIASAFPRHISPHQPFKDIAALAWERDSTSYLLQFRGDIFETEDQRNWTDASFKTYSTPLSAPFPVRYEAGDVISQAIRLSARHIVRVRGRSGGRVPELGTSIASGSAPSMPSGPSDGFGALLTEISRTPHPGAATVEAVDAARLADSMDLDLDARIVATTADDAVEVLRSLPLNRVRRLGVFGARSHITEDILWQAVAREARDLGFRGELVAGSRGHFTELNRSHRSAHPDADAVTYSITPQMHALEVEAIVDTLAMQTSTAAEALRIANGRPLHIGPITLAPRFNAVATEPPSLEDVPAAGPLHGDAFAAAWLLGSVSALSVPGVASISYGTVDELGLPTGRLLQQLAALRGLDVLEIAAGPHSETVVYPVQTQQGIVAFAANLTLWRTALRIIGPSGIAHDLDLAPWQTESGPVPC